MKISKSLPAFALILVLMLCLGASAFADDFQFQSTKDYAEALKTVGGFSCEPGEVVSLAEKDYEIVAVRYAGNRTTHESNFIAGVCEDGADVILSMTFLQFDQKDLADVMLAVNNLCAETTGVKFYVDMSDNTVIAEMFLIMGKELSPDIAVTGTTTFVGFTDTMYDKLVQYAA